MTRARVHSALATVAALAGAFVVWSSAPAVIALLGLGRFDLLARVLLVFAALGLAEKATTYLAARHHRTHQPPSKEARDDP